MKKRDERLLRQYIFGPEPAREEKTEGEEKDMVLDSSFPKWKMIFWEQNLKDGSCKMTEYTAKLFGIDKNLSNFPNCLYGKGIVSQQTEVAFRRAQYRLKAGEEQFSFEAVINTAGNMPKWFEISYCLEFDQDNMPLYAIGSAHDISSKKMLEQKYDDQIAYRNGLCANTLNCMRIDLTQDQITEYNTPVGEITEMCSMFTTADACLRKITEDMVRKSDIKKYKDILTTQGLLDAYHSGSNQVMVEYYDTMMQKWLQINFVILKNPSNCHIDCFGICNDISETKLLEIALNNVSKQDYASVGIIDTLAKEYLYVASGQTEGPVVNSYENIEEIFSFIIKQWEDSFSNVDKMLAKDKVFAVLEKQREYSVTFTAKEDDRRYQVYFSMIEEDEQLIMVGVRDITDDALLEKLRYDAQHDLLTGIYNREKAFEESTQLLKRYPETNFVLCHFDIQKFRLYNSFFGEKEGDALLIYIAEMFRELYKTHSCGVYGRIEADVFFLCFPYRENVIEQNQKYIHEKLVNYRKDFQITGNCGIYMIKGQKLSLEAMFNRAAIAAKDNRNKQLCPINYFNEASEIKMQREHEIALDMRQAIERKEFVVYLQPKYKLFTGEPFGAEALARWMHPKKGLIQPKDFIPLFESNGFIIQLDQYMWEEVCILLRKWMDEGKNPAPISVNMSRVSMYSPQTVVVLKSLVEKYNISPKLLNLELTESAYMDSPEEMQVRLKDLREAGFYIMMDDFGSGYSSLNTLREIPVDYLKVDRGFLASVDQDKKSRLVLASVVHMASRMDIPVITEGVETEGQRDFLKSIGCDYVQGYLYSRPMPVSDYEKKIVELQENYNTNATPKKRELSQISMNMDDKIQNFSNLLPYPLVFVEVFGDSFSYLSANERFLVTFGMHKDIMEREDLISKHISDEDYEKLYHTYKKAAQTKQEETCILKWKHSNGTNCVYMIQAKYVGKGEYAAVLISTFFEISKMIDKIKALEE